MNYVYDTPFLRYKTDGGKSKIINKNLITKIEEVDYYNGKRGQFVIITYEGSTLCSFKGTLENLKDFLEPYYL